MRLAAGLLVAVLAAAGLAAAAPGAADTKSSRVPLPVLPVAKGATCVAPTAEMRRNHMNMLFHQREETVRRGIRTTRFSLKGCVACHANPKTHSVLGKNGFCESCHAYAAVHIDCFECHSASPAQAGRGPAPAALDETARRVAAASFQGNRGP